MVRILDMKSPLYLTIFLPSGQLPLVLWRWHVGLLSQKRKEEDSTNNVQVGILNMQVSNLFFKI